MIKNFKHRGLENFFIDGSVAGINPQHAKKLRMILAMLNSVKEAKEMHTPGMRFHGLVGNKRNIFSVSVNNVNSI